MKQVIQDLRGGATQVVDVPPPLVRANHLLVRTLRTLISPGTERMLTDFGSASLIGKARQRPDKVREVLDKVRTDGIVQTAKAVRGKLAQPLPLGYCNVGVVEAVGIGVTGFAVGDRVASNGPHAETVLVPANLCARVPDGISDDEAAFTVLGAVALEGIRLAEPTLGESVAVIGLGVVGQLAVQLLMANGCRVLAIDLNATRLGQAADAGAEVVQAGAADVVAAASRFTQGRGVDAVIVTAATPSSQPMHEAAQMCRKRGRIVLVGVTGLELERGDFYEKELSFQVSCSYGPGRYDPAYEVKGQDYPVGFVRWTAQRNFEAVLDLMAAKRVVVAGLVSHRYPVERAGEAYALVAGKGGSLGILLEYLPPSKSRADSLVPVTTGRPAMRNPLGGVSFVGAGNYAAGTLIPAFKAAGARLRFVVSTRGLSSLQATRRQGFDKAVSDVAEIFSDPETAAVVIATRHDSHAELAVMALRAGKHVFVEKPLCMTADELASVRSAYEDAVREGRAPILMVGFNRRFAPLTQALKGDLARLPGPKAFIMTVNAGSVPANHWTQDETLGGGRLVGEACHFVDLLRYLAGAAIGEVRFTEMDGPTKDTATLSLGFSDGSLGTIHYFANGHRSFPKERLEVFAGGRVFQLDNFRRLRAYGARAASHRRVWRQDKGQMACAKAFLEAIRGRAESPIPAEELFEVSDVLVHLASRSAGDGGVAAWPGHSATPPTAARDGFLPVGEGTVQDAVGRRQRT
ncbi:MAG: bi-domain-containing oxidoreductase [Thermoplasmatota archaeon]